MDNPQFVATAIQFIQITVTKNSITLQPNQQWQPSVMLLRDFEKEWISCFNHSFMAFYRDHQCRTTDPRFSISMNKMTVKEYSNDIRFTRHLFAELPKDLPEFEELLVYFPPEYTLNALEVDVKDYSVLQDTGKITTTVNAIGQELGSFLHKHFPDYYFEILPMGSRSYGTYTASTDFNFCVVMDTPDLDWIVENKNNSEGRLFRLHPAESDQLARMLSSHPVFRKASYDHTFNTIRYNHEQMGHVEFVFNKRIYTECTDLINRYIELDNRVGQLIASIKSFVQIRSVTKGGLHGGGFYQYCLMALAYLQQLDPPIIPNLQHLGFGNTDCCRVASCRTNRKYWDIALSGHKYVGAAAHYHTCVSQGTELPTTPNHVQQDGKGGYYWNSGNTAKISELILGFFYYYGYEFNFKRYGVSLKNGGLVTKLGKDPYFYIEHPFLAGVNVADNSRIQRGISFFLGAFIIMYNEEKCFKEVLHISGLLQIPGAKRLVTTKVPFQPLRKRRLLPATAVSFLLIGLPKSEPNNACFCADIEEEFKSLGRVLHMESLDNTTKRIYIALRDPVDAREIQLKTPIKMYGKRIHVAKLYGFTIAP